MRKIIVPTDFSDCAGYATDLAVALAAPSDGEVILYSNIPVHPLWDKLSDDQKIEYPKSLAGMYDLMNHFQEFIDRYAEPNVKFDCRYSAGTIHHAVENMANEESADLVIVGSHGSRGIKEVLFGSNAQKIARHVTRPVLVVKAPVKDVPFKRVIFASNFDDSSKTAFRQLLNLLKGSNAQINLLSIRLYPNYTDPEADLINRMSQFEMMAQDFQLGRYILDDQDLERGIQAFIQAHGADLLVMQQSHHSLLFRLLLGSAWEAIVNHAPIPVLILNDISHSKD